MGVVSFDPKVGHYGSLTLAPHTVLYKNGVGYEHSKVNCCNSIYTSADANQKHIKVQYQSRLYKLQNNYICDCWGHNSKLKTQNWLFSSNLHIFLWRPKRLVQVPSEINDSATRVLLLAFMTKEYERKSVKMGIFKGWGRIHLSRADRQLQTLQELRLKLNNLI